MAVEPPKLCVELGRSEGQLPNFAIEAIISGMSTMNISLPDSLKGFVDEQVSSHGYGTSSEYVRELIRKDRDRTRLRGLLLDAASSPVVAEMGPGYFAELRTRVRKRSAR